MPVTLRLEGGREVTKYIVIRLWLVGENRNIYRLRYLGREPRKMQSRENRFGDVQAKHEKDKKKWRRHYANILKRRM